MSQLKMTLCTLLLASFGASNFGAVAWAEDAAPSKTKPATPEEGKKVADFSLKSPAGEAMTLSKLAAKGPVVIVMLRGFPGYQCPICSRQVGDLLTFAEEFEAAKASVVLIYPGPSKALEKRAQEFVRGRTLPKHFYFVIDPNYKQVNAWKLRWDAPRETAYPATFVLDKSQKVVYANVSKSHGGRVPAKTVVQKLPTE